MDKTKAILCMIQSQTVEVNGLLYKFDGTQFLVKDIGASCWELGTVNRTDNLGWEIYNEPKKEFDIKPFDRVLVRDGDGGTWKTDLFERMDANSCYTFSCMADNWDQIATYQENESKLGTTEDIENKFTEDDL
jgi:hypothetical protein